MKKKINVLHYLNQFYGGIGGEEKGDAPLEFRAGAVGIGEDLARLLGPDFVLSTTAICGDNYFQENQEEVLGDLREKLQNSDVDLIVAGPAFGAGRYGIACGAVCDHLTKSLGIFALTGISPDNPGVEMYRQNERIYMLPTTKTMRGMKDALIKMAAFAQRISSGKEIGPAKKEGYLPRGIRKVIFREETGAKRAVGMLEARLQGRAYESELVLPVFEKVTPPAPISDISKAKIALVTTAGVVPKGNPDQIKALNAENWARYPLDLLLSRDYECIHGGINPDYINARAEFVVPVQTAYKQQEQGQIGALFDQYFVTAGCGGVIHVFQRMGHEMAEALADMGADGVILTST